MKRTYNAATLDPFDRAPLDRLRRTISPPPPSRGQRGDKRSIGNLKPAPQNHSAWRKKTIFGMICFIYNRNMLGKGLISLGIKALRLLEKQHDSSSRHIISFIISLVSRSRPPEALVHSGWLKRADTVKRGWGRPNLTWEECVKSDMKNWFSQFSFHHFVTLCRTVWGGFLTLSTHLLGNRYLLSIMWLWN
ncbi:uncharacterized protein [Triticum aestivum]|uniref:uncharacterized protein isoform X2 n=1 Tax=Triticum aestivum TaxID=4565 RepID=UPI001D019070|nr:uncharacterized protein LOC123165374 isoform X2 [Triticum aestivum]